MTTRIPSRNRPGTVSRIPYYWVIAAHGGRPVIIGPKTTEQEAMEFGYLKLDVPFEVVSLPTRDRARATSMLKAKRLDATADLNLSLNRAIHERGLRAKERAGGS